MNGTTTIAEFRNAVLDPAKRAHYRLAWISTVDHKRIAVLYMLTALVFFVIGGVEALFIRLQLAVPNNHFLHPDTFNQLFTMHGTTMIFLVVMPVVFGLANYVLPLQIGARDMAFPRLNAFGCWCVPFGGILLHFSVLAGGAPAVGWFSYAPLSETPYSSSPGADYWAVALFVLGIGSISFAINTIATVISLRGPGMTMRRLPLFTWINFVNAFIVIFALPVLNAGLAMLLIDRQLQGHFFLPFRGGSPVLWQHIFWAFGHPEVYIMALPAFAIVSEIIPVFSRKPIFGYEFVAASSVAIAVLSLGVWGHHMFTVGMGRPLDMFFAISSMLIAIPTGVKVLNWTATMIGGRIRFQVPMLFCIAFLVQFLLAGITGISHAVVPLDWQTKNSYFLVAHFHFVAVGGIVFAVLGGLQYWFPKMSGRMMSERLGKWAFWLMVIGFNMTFVIQHFLGLLGMPRRIYTYPDLPHWGWMNMLSTTGVFFMSAAALILVWNLATSFFRGKVARGNPSRSQQGRDPNLHSFRSRILRDASSCLFVFLRSARGRSGTERAGCSADAGVQHLSFREQFYFLVIRGWPNETASRFHAWLACTDDPARRYLPCWSGERILETVSDRDRSQHQYVFNHVLHPDWLPRFARAPWFNRAADLSLGGVGGRFRFWPRLRL